MLKSGNVLVAGGAEQAEVFEVAANRFVPVPGNLDGPHYFASATLLNSGKVLIVDGYGRGSASRGPVSTTQAWVYEP